MTDAKMNKSDKPLDKMTVKELREIAKEVPDLSGVHAMKKDELLAALKARQSAGEAAEAPTPQSADAKASPKKPATAAKKKGAVKKEGAKMTVQEMKGLIRSLKAKRQQALSDQDKKRASIYRRRISRLKKQTRKAA